jgi:glycosyltransferase 2 family protein
VQLAVLGLVAYLALRLVQLWGESDVDVSSANTTLLVVAGFASLAAVVAYGLVWPFILRALGARAPRDSLGLFLKSQLGKYLPGSIWHYAGRVGLARARGIPARLTLVSLGVEVAASATAAAIVSLFVLPLVLAIPLASAAVLLVAFSWIVPGFSGSIGRRLRRLVARVVPAAQGELGLVFRTLPPTIVRYLPVWLLYGVAFWTTGRALVPIPASELVYFTAVFALGWLAGMVVVFAPGGIGVREAVLVALLAPRVGSADAIVIAAASRIFLTASDLFAGVAAMAVSRARQPGRRALAGGKP